MQGTSGNNLMKGLAGRDVFWGREGSDVMRAATTVTPTLSCSTPRSGKDVDWIMDFNPVDDGFRLENAIFTKLSSVGKLPTDMSALDFARTRTNLLSTTSRPATLPTTWTGL